MLLVILLSSRQYYQSEANTSDLLKSLDETFLLIKAYRDSSKLCLFTTKLI